MVREVKVAREPLARSGDALTALLLAGSTLTVQHAIRAGHRETLWRGLEQHGVQRVAPSLVFLVVSGLTNLCTYDLVHLWCRQRH